MATTLGKRKRRSQLSSPEPTSPSTTNNLHALFQQHFEAKYAPLPTSFSRRTTTPPTPPSGHSSDSEDSAWEGLSSASSLSDDAPVQVIAHTTHARSKRAEVPRSELRAFMKPNPPSTTLSTPAPAPTSKKTPAAAATDPTDRALFANDLALQRLLAESHLLHPSSTSSHTSTPPPTGTPGLTTRHRALDLRVQALGAKRSLLAQQKMPMAIRKGMEAKKAEREEVRRREAREGGVVLERRGGREQRRGVRRGKGEGEVGGPGVGRWKGGMLVLGKGDVEAIEGRKRAEGMGRGKGRGRARGRGR